MKGTEIDPSYLPDEIRFEKEIANSPFLRSVIDASHAMYHAQEWPMELTTLTGAYYTTILKLDRQSMRTALSEFSQSGIIHTTVTNYGKRREDGSIGSLPAIDRNDASGFIALCMVLRDDFGEERSIDTREVALKTRVKLNPLSLMDTIHKPPEDEAKIIENPFYNPKLPDSSVNGVIHAEDRFRQNSYGSGASEDENNVQEIFDDTMQHLSELLMKPTAPKTMTTTEITNSPQLLLTLGISTGHLGKVITMLRDHGILEPNYMPQKSGRGKRYEYSREQILALGALIHVLHTDYKKEEDIELPELIQRTKGLLGVVGARDAISDVVTADEIIVHNPLFHKKKSGTTRPTPEKKGIERYHVPLTGEKLADILDNFPDVDSKVSLNQLSLHQQDIQDLLEFRRLTTRGEINEDLFEIHEALRAAVQILIKRPRNTLKDLVQAARNSK